MTVEDNFPCPKCGAPVSRQDRFCKNCGAVLAAESTVSQVSPQPEEVYERRFSLVERLAKLLISPSEAMEDITRAPDYVGVFLVIVATTLLSAVSIFLVLQRISFTGTYAEAVSGLVTSILMLSVFLTPIVFVVRWLVKSLIVKCFCDGGCGWSFGTAASVTGYAYLPEIVVGFVGVVVVWSLLPSFTVDMTSLEAAQQSISSHMAELTWLRLLFSLPASFIGLAWKSYLGGLGTHFGTKKSCSIWTGAALFFVLGLVGLLVSYLISA